MGRLKNIISSQDFYIKLLALIGLPMIFVNLYVNGYQAIIEILNGNTSILYRDFEVYVRTVQFFLDDPSKLYWIPEWMGENWFIYPPLSILIFLPFGVIPEPWNLILWRAFNLIIYYYSIRMLLTTLGQRYKVDLDRNRIYVYLIAFSLGSFFLNINHGQVNIITLYFAVLSFCFLQKNRIITSSGFFAAGFWLKLYPITLFPLFLKDNKTLKTAILSITGFVIILPLLLSPIIPIEQYRYFFFDFLPYFVNLPHDMSPCNQSVMCFLMHFYLPVDTFGDYLRFEILSWIRISNSLLFISSVILIFILFIRDKKRHLHWAFSSLLAISPVFSVTGWEAVYILSLPLIISILYQIRDKSLIIKMIVILCIILLYLPKPPSGLIAQYTNTVPFLFQMLFFFRYMFITIFMIILSYRYINKNEINQKVSVT